MRMYTSVQLLQVHKYVQVLAQVRMCANTFRKYQVRKYMRKCVSAQVLGQVFAQVRNYMRECAIISTKGASAQVHASTCASAQVRKCISTCASTQVRKSSCASAQVYKSVQVRKCI